MKLQEKAVADALPGARLFLEALEAALKAQFGVRNPQLLDFGIGIPKPKVQRTAEEKAISAAKARQTRAAHGILGKNQRAALSVGGSPGLTLVSPTGEAAPGVVTRPVPPADLSKMPPPVVPTAPNGGDAGSGGSNTAQAQDAAGTPGQGGTPGKGGTPSGG